MNPPLSHEIPGSEPTDEQVMARVLGGDTEAFGLIVVRYREPLGRFIVRYFRWDPERVQELVQRSLVKAYERRGLYDPARPLKPWIYRLARNLCLDERRSWKPSVPVEELENAGSREMDPEQAYVKGERLRRAAAAMERLPQRQREVLSMLWQGLRYGEIAAALDIAESTVRHTARNALANLAKDTRTAPSVRIGG